ncbi:MAG TPA: hypothetical protein VEA80_20115 [Vitreimonas sp.]|nr:hypothetical protein [Vitreimonas sp.]HYD89796.1 hypothetical protein [Vitreimonas sp.]
MTDFNQTEEKTAACCSEAQAACACDNAACNCAPCTCGDNCRCND